MVLASLHTVTGTEVERQQDFTTVDSTLKLLLLNCVSSLVIASFGVMTEDLDLNKHVMSPGASGVERSPGLSFGQSVENLSINQDLGRGGAYAPLLRDWPPERYRRCLALLLPTEGSWKTTTKNGALTGRKLKSVPVQRSEQAHFEQNSSYVTSPFWGQASSIPVRRGRRSRYSHG